MNRVDWSLVQDFLAVAETGSLSGAARKLKTSQPTVGRRISELEAQLDSILFTRTPKGFLLSSEGEQLLAHARRMEDEAFSIEREMAGAESEVEGTVRVSLTEGLGFFWLPSRLMPLLERHPKLTVEMSINNDLANLSRREADIALRMERPVQPDLIIKKIGELEPGLLASKTYLKRHGTPEHLRDLKDHILVGYDETWADTDWYKSLEKLFRGGRSMIKTNSFMGQISAVEAGAGIGANHVYHAITMPNVVNILPELKLATFEVHLVAHADLLRSAKIRVVADHLAACFKHDQAMFRRGYDGPGWCDTVPTEKELGWV